MYRDLRRVTDAYLRPEEKLFDFTNEPALFFYALSATRARAGSTPR